MTISLDDIAAGAPVPALTRDEISALLVRLAAIHGSLAAALASVGGPTVPAREDRLLDAAEAAVKLGVKPAWLYRRSRELPFVVRLDGKVRFSTAGIERYIATRRGQA